MIFTKMTLEDVFVIEPDRREDDRGFFTRAWCRNEFDASGVHFRPVQANLAFTKKRGTLRGLHYQVAPHQEIKLVRCVKGAIFDVIIDLRKESRTHLQWLSVELTSDNGKALLVPEGFAHGYQTLRDGTEVLYQVSQFYHPESERGVRWNDPAFAIKWPKSDNPILSDKDKNWPDYICSISSDPIAKNEFHGQPTFLGA